MSSAAIVNATRSNHLRSATTSTQVLQDSDHYDDTPSIPIISITESELVASVSNADANLKEPDLAEDDEKLYDTDLEIEDEREAYDFSGSRVYMETCRELGVVPVSYFVRHMNEPEIVMKHHGVGPLGAKAIAIPLITNTTLLRLDLEDNWLEDEGAIYLAEMLKENCFITELTIAENRVGSKGATALCDMLQINTSLTKVNFSGNDFQDQDGVKFANAILENSYVRELDLSHNKFGDGAGEVLGHAIGENETLETLDLSWNSFRVKSGVALIDGIKVNTRLKRVSLAWNGLGNEGALALADCLKNNSILTELDISNNRITLDGVMIMAKGLEQNEMLQTLKMGKNPIGTAGAHVILAAINNERSVLTKLDLQDVMVDKQFDELHREILQSRQIDISHGGIIGNYVLKGIKAKTKNADGESAEDAEMFRELEEFLKNDPMAVIRMYVEKNNLRLLDFFNQFDKEKKYKITPEDFKKGVKQAKMELTDAQIDTLVERLDYREKDGMIDYRPFLSEAETKSL